MRLITRMYETCIWVINQFTGGAMTSSMDLLPSDSLQLMINFQ